jgi:hypothetical protein
MRVSVSQLRVIGHRYSKESQSSSPVGEPRVYRTGVMGSRDPSQSVGPSNTSPLAVPEAELIIALGARTLQLDCEAKTEALRLADLTIRRLASQPPREDIHQGIQSEPPTGFIENNGQLHYFSIPLQGGSNDRRIAPYIQLLDGPVPRAAGTLGGPDDPVFTTEVYAQPSSNVGVANPPVPKWLLRAIDGDSEIFDAFALEVQDTTQDWGLYTDICRYHHTDVELTNIASRIRALEAEEAETRNTLANCRRRLRAANAGETLAHLAGNDADRHDQRHGAGIIRYATRGRACI